MISALTQGTAAAARCHPAAAVDVGRPLWHPAATMTPMACRMLMPWRPRRVEDAV